MWLEEWGLLATLVVLLILVLVLALARNIPVHILQFCVISLYAAELSKFNVFAWH